MGERVWSQGSAWWAEGAAVGEGVGSACLGASRGSPTGPSSRKGAVEEEPGAAGSEREGGCRPEARMGAELVLSMFSLQRHSLWPWLRGPRAVLGLAQAHTAGTEPA